jgi:hypothetical protein
LWIEAPDLSLYAKLAIPITPHPQKEGQIYR